MSKDASKWRVLDQTMAEARTGFADLSVEEIEALADKAVAAAREAGKTLKAPAREVCLTTMDLKVFRLLVEGLASPLSGPRWRALPRAG